MAHRDGGASAGGWVGAACLLLLADCQPTPTPRDQLPEPTQVGEHLRFYTDEGDGGVCAGSLEYMDRYLDELIQIHDASPDLVADYYWFPSDHGRIDEICSSGTACAFTDGVIVTSIIPHEHELVHAVRGELGFSQDFLEEGAAEMWGAHNDRDFDYTRPVELGIELAEESLPIPYYGVAGRFSSFVRHEYGLEAFLEIGKLAPSGSSPVEVDRAFESVTGMTASVITEHYDAADWWCGRSIYRDDSISCAIAQQLECGLAAEDGTLSVEFDLDCSSERFVGPRDGMIWSDVTFQLTRGRIVYLGVTANEGEIATVWLRRCDVGCEDQAFTLIPNVAMEESSVILDEGRYLIRLEVPADGRPRGSAVLTIRNACPPM